MSSDTVEKQTNGLPLRAEIAVLTLRLRTLQQAAAELEAQEGSDPSAALRQLEARIEPLIEERRRKLHAELELERLAAEQSVIDAQRQSADMLREASFEAERKAQLERQPSSQQVPEAAAPADEDELERARLAAELQVAQGRVVEAKRAKAEREQALREAVHAEVLDLQRRLNELDARHAEVLAQIREDAKAESKRIIADARAQVTIGHGGDHVE